MADLIISQPMTFTVDVRNGLVERPQRESLMRGDKMANRIVAELVYGSEPFDITGVTVKGKFCRPPSGDEIDLAGEAKGNVATVQLTDQCYTSGGHYEARVILVLGGVERTVLFISGDVLKSGSGNAAGDEETGGSGGSTGSGLPAGGTAGQVLVKVSSAQGDAIWKTLTAADVGARPDNWMPTAADVGALPSDGTAADSTKLDGKDSVYYLGARNLLDNSDFRNPVNQRGIAYGATHDSGYKIDRWRYRVTGTESDAYFGLVEKTYTSMKPPADGYVDLIQNLIDYETMKGKTYTFALRAGYRGAAQTMIVSFVMGGEGSGRNLTDDGSIKLYSIDGMNIVIRLFGETGTQDELAMWWAALYEGTYTADNLPPYVPKGYAVELAACNVADTGCTDRTLINENTQWTYTGFAEFPTSASNTTFTTPGDGIFYLFATRGETSGNTIYVVVLKPNGEEVAWFLAPAFYPYAVYNLTIPVKRGMKIKVYTDSTDGTWMIRDQRFYY